MHTLVSCLCLLSLHVGWGRQVRLGSILIGPTSSCPLPSTHPPTHICSPPACVQKREYGPRQTGPKLPKMPALQASGWIAS